MDLLTHLNVPAAVCLFGSNVIRVLIFFIRRQSKLSFYIAFPNLYEFWAGNDVSMAVQAPLAPEQASEAVAALTGGFEVVASAAPLVHDIPGLVQHNQPVALVLLRALLPLPEVSSPSFLPWGHVRSRTSSFFYVMGPPLVLNSML